MKYYLLFFLTLISTLLLDCKVMEAQTEGSVSYITPQNVYVKFASTREIKPGDTLFIKKNDKLVPALKVKELSSISCVCFPLEGIKLEVQDKVYEMVRQSPGQKKEEKAPPPPPPPVLSAPVTKADIKTDTTVPPKPVLKTSTQQVHGYLSVASYTNFSNESSTNSQRMRYTFSLNALNIGESRFSAECYISFYHGTKQWSEIRNNIFNGLKIYNLNVSYAFNRNMFLLAGRKINPRLANMGANDGLQFEFRVKPVYIGIIAGFRPNWLDYSFDGKLFQYGAYVYHELAGKNGVMQSTVAYVEQRNDWKTDRRYVYLQHINSLVRNLTFIGSVEADLYKETLSMPDSVYKGQTTFSLTNLYLSLNYRVIRQLSFSLSYSALRNVVYYESYKNFLDQLLNPQLLQGYSFTVTTRPVTNLSAGVSIAYRVQKNDPKPAKNLYAYVTYSRVPWVNLSVTGTYTLLSTSYISGSIYGIGISKDLVRGKLYMDLGYRYIDYNYYNSEFKQIQNMGQVSLSWRIIRKLLVSGYYEGTFQNPVNYNRIYAQVNWSF
jgi:hypothetical protein